MRRTGGEEGGELCLLCILNKSYTNNNDFKYLKIITSIRQSVHIAVMNFELNQLFHENEFSNLCSIIIIHITYQ